MKCPSIVGEEAYQFKFDNRYRLGWGDNMDVTDGELPSKKVGYSLQQCSITDYY